MFPLSDVIPSRTRPVVTISLIALNSLLFLYQVQLDEAKHIFTTADQVEHTEHCAICHWVRTLKPNLSATEAVGTDLLHGTAVGARAPGIRRDPAADRLPARAPPSVLH